MIRVILKELNELEMLAYRIGYDQNIANPTDALSDMSNQLKKLIVKFDPDAE